MATVLDINAYGQADLRPAEPEKAPPELISWLQNEEQRSQDSALTDQRAAALDFYNGEPFGDEEDGRSQIVTRDVAEVVDYMVPSVLRTMVSGDRVVEFEALDEQDKDALDEATEAISQQFMQEQDGWRILHDALKGGLLEKTQAIKSYVEEKRVRRERDVTATELAMLLEDGAEITEAEPIGQFAELDEVAQLLSLDDPDSDQLGPILRVAWQETSPKFCDDPLPNEEFDVAPDARTLGSSVYYAHTTPKMISDLKDMGFMVEGPTFDDGAYVNTELTRARDAGTKQAQENIWRDGPTRKVWYREEYCRYDLNGDGIAELMRVQRVGNNILRDAETGKLAIEEIEDGPCEEWCPFPMPHRRVGQSLADKVMDIQRTRSVMMRQFLDNLYQSNAPRTLVHEQSMGDSTIDDILTVRPGALIRWTGTHKPEPWSVPFVAGPALEALEVMSGERESRTGITRLNQGLDADTLNKTATGTALMQAQGQQIEEYIARNFAEFIGRVFGKKYRLMREYGKPFTVMIDGVPKKVDPSRWPEEMRVVVRVGLGSGRKEQRVQYRMLMLGLQKEAIAAGMANVTAEEVYNSIKGLSADLQLGQATQYFKDPATMGEQPETPDPAMAEAQAKAEIEVGRLQLEEKNAQAENEMKARQQQIDAELQVRKADQDMAIKAESAALEAELKRARAIEEATLAREKFEFEKQLATQRLEFEREQAEKRAAQEASLPKNRPGGDLAE